MASDSLSVSKFDFGGPWHCQDCYFTAYDYPSAEYHRRRGHTLIHDDRMADAEERDD